MWWQLFTSASLFLDRLSAWQCAPCISLEIVTFDKCCNNEEYSAVFSIPSSQNWQSTGLRRRPVHAYLWFQLRPKIHGYTGFKRTCAAEQASCTVYLTGAWSKTCSAEHRWFARAWFSAHPRCSLSRKHVTSTQGSDGLLNKPTFLSQKEGWGDIPTGSKNNRLNQPKAQEPCTVHCTCHKKIVQNHVPCKQTVLTIWTKGTANWVKWGGTAMAERGPTATLHQYTIHTVYGARDLESTMAQGL